MQKLHTVPRIVGASNPFNSLLVAPNDTKLGRQSPTIAATKPKHAFLNSSSEAVATLFKILQLLRQRLPFAAPLAPGQFGVQSSI